MKRYRALFALTLSSGLAVGLALPGGLLAQDELPEDNGIYTYHSAPRYRASESHPLRTAAYVVHPVGWVLREVFYRPWSALAGSTRFTRSFFGFREPRDFSSPVCFLDKEIPDCNDIAPYNSLAKPMMDAPEGVEVEEVMTERQVFVPNVNFEFDKASLNQLGKGRVRQIAQLLSSVPDLTVVVEGHTDYKGTDEYNDKLGSRRAQTVIDELVQLGVDPARMSVVSYGESRPIFAEEEDWARAVNRRVQFTVGGAEGAQPAAPTKAVEASADSAGRVYTGDESVARAGNQGVISQIDDVKTF